LLPAQVRLLGRILAPSQRPSFETTYPLQGPSWQCSFKKNRRTLACANLGAGTIDFHTYPGVAYQYSVDAGLNAGDNVSAVAFTAAAKN
jgi:hypothetical protein